ncbi:MAG: hypothetical protein ACI9SP_003749 [Arenicella sp.]|jgi:hypothetical protein
MSYSVKTLSCFNLETSVEREKDVQLIGVNKEFRKCEVTLLVMNTFMDSLGILRSCAGFRVSTEVSRFKQATR